MKAQPVRKRVTPKVFFPRRTPRSTPTKQQESQQHQAPTSSPQQQQKPTMASVTIPPLFTTYPPIRDSHATASSHLQDSTVQDLLPYLSVLEDLGPLNHHGLPRLFRPAHIKFLKKQLGPLPSAYTSADPSRPWFFYWCLQGMSLLGEDVVSYREQLIETVRPMQDEETGGFAGGFGQMAHLATTYATILSLALVGGEEAYEVVDRRGMWKWLGSLKQPDGGFQMTVGGEEDVRGAYCAAVIISLLKLPLDLPSSSPACAAGHTSFFSGLPEWVQQCQTYEGGVSAKPGSEAHGAYAFCALACLSVIDSPHRIIPRYINLPRLISWLSSRQNAPEGGFSGRTNKLVDGCYSHWVGGCWPLIEASRTGPKAGFPVQDVTTIADTKDDDSLYSRNGLIRYIMACCQDNSSRGGLRDKPSKWSDAYHTCYVLNGLSSAQHKWTLVAARPEEAVLGADQWVATPFMGGDQVFEEEDRLCTTHPVYVIPQHKVEECSRYFASKQGF